MKDTRWTAHPNRATDAKYTVTHAGGDTLVTVNQEQNNGAWILLGTYSMAPGAGHKVSLTDQANGYVIADAIQLLDATSPEFNTATWTPNAPVGQYEVYAKWTANGNRATNATYTITHAQGQTQIPVNQQANGGAFNLLGTFNLNGSSTITLSDQANGYVIADAIQLIPLTTTLKMYFVHTDHLNTPRLITSDTGQAVWSWANDDPYGNNAPNENPSGAGNFTCNLRLPGQYFDAELNTHYNYFRDYDPATGRYVQSDPIGLAGGINTYGYVGGNPINDFDLEGLLGRGAGKNTANVTIAPYIIWLATSPVGMFPIPSYSTFPGSCGSGTNFPNQYGTANFEPACQRHDVCYACAKSAGDREPCDRRFLIDLIGACNNNSRCERAAFAYFSAVSAAGKSSFNASLSQKQCNVCR